MRALSSPLRKQLEISVLAARRAAESASRAAIDGLGVFADRRPEHLGGNHSALRNGLRAKWRQLDGDREQLIAECAYEQWHRLLFARFLAENNLLLDPRYRAPLTLADCEELAAELGEPDGWSVAARFAAEILPGIFRVDDPCVRLRLAPEGRHALEQTLNALSTEIFTADDAIGWVYQFWQKDQKDAVNASGRKIGGAELGPVTQLFTENYMVRFLLENSLGAWWTSRHPDSPLVAGFDYLRYDDNGRPSAGSFAGWPERVAEVTVLDPCCGSGHFLVEAFSMLWQMRVEEEELERVDAQDAVLRDNLFGLELDARCVQIAMFNVALQAWKAGGGWRQLPLPNIACSGHPVRASVEEWRALAGGDARLENALARLHILFRDADTLGSLIDPKRVAEISEPKGSQRSFEDVSWDLVSPLLTTASLDEDTDEDTAVLSMGAETVSRAAHLLSRHYTLVATNVPYLGRGKQDPTLIAHLDRYLPSAASDLATAFLARFEGWVAEDGSWAAVTSQNWLFSGSYQRFRAELLGTHQFEVIAELGSRAFGAQLYEFPVILSIVGGHTAPRDYQTAIISCGRPRSPAETAEALASSPVTKRLQATWLGHRGHRIVLSGSLTGLLIDDVASVVTGLQHGDKRRFVRFFWEMPRSPGWSLQLSAANPSIPYGGRQEVVFWEDGCGALASHPSAVVRGTEAWGRRGVSIARMGALSATLYEGELFDQNCAAVIPHDRELLPALWAFLSSQEYATSVRAVDKRAGVAPSSLGQVQFDEALWRDVAAPLPEPGSSDPTQWLFAGRPNVATAPLQVAVARLVGYRWPEQAEFDDLNVFTDSDGIVCLPPVAGEAPATERVLQVLAAAFGESWSPAKVKELLEQSGSRKQNLGDWLRDEFFKQHCALFGNRPFVWHIWDGQRDGFSALVNYHKLNHRTLEKLTYTYLGQDWVERQRAQVRDEVAGADARLSAARGLQRKLQAILDGEVPLDIYVRWKEILEQPVGWEPDLHDGVRVNVRPFVEASVLRAPFSIHWRKDRGGNLDGSQRENDIHLMRAEKLEARKRAGRA